MIGPIVAITATLLVLGMNDVKAESSSKKCECAAFAVDDHNVPIPLGVEPLLSQNPMNTTCDEEGARSCEMICIELAKVGKERADDFICMNVKHASVFQPSLWARICDRPWKFTGLKCEKTFCCHDGKSVPCDQMA